jgi:hypothetical protein
MNKEQSTAESLILYLKNDSGLIALNSIEPFIFEKPVELQQVLLSYAALSSRPNRKGDNPPPLSRSELESLISELIEADVTLNRFIKQMEGLDNLLKPHINARSEILLTKIENFCQSVFDTFQNIAKVCNRPITFTDADNFSFENYTFFILETLAHGKSSTITDPFYLQFWEYLRKPDTNTLIIWPQQKSRISINLLGKPFSDHLFDEQLIEWANEIGLSSSNPENTGCIITELLLRTENRQYWNFEPEQPVKSLLFSGYHSDGIDTETDQLNITPDVDALAALIAYEKLNPPLSIGLFGHWGSGKSFFMKLLSKKISEYEEAAVKASTPNGFCKEIVQIEFNAWHYSDANLWANFMVTIFEKLNEKIVPKKRDEKALLLEQFQLAGAEVARQNAQLKQITNEIESLNIQLGNLKEENNKKASELAGLRPADIWNVLDPEQRKQIEDNLAGIAKELGLDKAQLAAKSLKEFLTEIRKIRGRIQYLFNLYINSNFQQILIWTLIFTLPLLFIMYLRFGNPPDNLSNLVTGTKGYLITIASLFFSFVAWGTPKLRRLNQHIDKIEEARTKVDAIIEQKRRELAGNEIKIQLELDQLKSEQQRIELQKTDAEKRKLELELAIDNYNPRKQLIDFISNRGGSNDYNQHLGIISLIRNDLQKLSDLLSQNLSYVPDNKEQEKFAALPGIQRIVLYIDDLDRCPPDRVKQVLEAIHLLLSFKLFVVVVGVDARWVKYALVNESSKLLRNEETDERATAFDYLEKIFQIPFTLKPLNSESRKKLLSSYLNSVTQTDKEQTSISKLAENISSTEPVQEIIEQALQSTIVPEATINLSEIISSNQEKTSLSNIVSETNEQIAPEQIKLSRQQLIISPEEIEFIHKISNLLGNKPRTIKRFVNIYRLIRVHNEVPDYSITTHADHLAIMLLLALVTGCNADAGAIFQLFTKTSKDTFNEFVTDQTLLETMENNTELYNTITKLSEIEDRIEMSLIQKYIPFISRFSFRSLTDV